MCAGRTVADQKHNYLPRDYVLKLDTHSKIPIAFWNYEPEITFKEEPLKAIETHLDLLAEKPDDSNGVLDKKVERKTKKLLTQLKKAGFDFRSSRDGFSDESPEYFDYMSSPVIQRMATAWAGMEEMGNSGFYRFEVFANGSYFFLIDRDQPTKLFFLRSFESGCSVDVQELSDVKLRIFLSSAAGPNGRGAAETETSVFDLDFQKKNVRKYTWASDNYGGSNLGYEMDFKKDGNYSMVVCPIVDGFCVGWTWVYSWDGQQWVNKSLEYWDLYKNGQLGAKGFGYCEKKNEDIISAFQASIKNGEPLQYWKEFQR